MGFAAAREPSPDFGDEGFRFTHRDFERVRGLIHAHAGIALNPTKQRMVYSRLSRRLRLLGTRSFTAYLDDLEATPSGHGEWQEFVNALTTNLTSFFREPHHFPILATRIAERAKRGPVRIWCCAASTGEEPYTIAITAMQACGSRTPPVEILATDIDTTVLGKAQQGVYSDEAVAKLDADILKAYFLRGRGANAGLVRLQDDVQALIAYRPLNLLAPNWHLEQKFDAIFCRNVMIYFDKDTQYRVLQGLAAALEPGGLLFAGHSENFTQARDLFELLGRTVYRPVVPAR